MKKNLFLSGITVVLLLIFVGCFEDLGLNSNKEEPPAIPELIIFKAPTSTNVPENLKNSIDMLNNYMATGYTYLSIATINQPNTKENVSTWTVSVGNFTAEIRAEKKSETMVDWSVTINGSDGNISYNNWVALQGSADIAGTSGTWHIFAENSTEQIATFDYSVDEAGKKQGTLTQQDSESIYDVVNNPDKSGQFVKKVNGVKVYEAIWGADGAGEWKVFDSSGAVVDSGSWT